MEIKWTARVKNKEVLHRVKKERNILHTRKRLNFTVDLSQLEWEPPPKDVIE
jgi:hypothetical protein